MAKARYELTVDETEARCSCGGRYATITVPQRRFRSISKADIARLSLNSKLKCGRHVFTVSDAHVYGYRH